MRTGPLDAAAAATATRRPPFTNRHVHLGLNTLEQISLADRMSHRSASTKSKPNMGLLAEYGSDSGSDEEQIAGPSVPPPPPPASTSKPQVKKRAAVKIGLDLKPRLGEDEEDEDRVVPGDSRKKPRLGDAGGKGKSALLDMLPPPKRSLPASKTGPSTGASTVGNPIGGADVGLENESDTSKQPTTASLLPPSLRNKAGKSKAPTQAAEIDFFGLGQLSSFTDSLCTIQLTALLAVSILSTINIKSQSLHASTIHYIHPFRS